MLMYGVNGKALQLHAVYKKPYLFLLQHMHNHCLILGFIVVDKLVLLIILHSMGQSVVYLQCRPPSSAHSPLQQ